MAEIAVLAELEANGIAYTWAGESEVRATCPFHDDNSPSCCINLEKRVFRCPVCKVDGDFVSFLAGWLKADRRLVWLQLAKKYGLEDGKVVNTSVIEDAHQRIWVAGPLLKALHDRGVTDAMIRRYRLGEKDGRVTIPVKSAAGLYVNIRSYLPGAPGADKMRNMRGHGEPRLYPIEQLEYKKVVICGGEIKAIVAADQLNQHGIGAVSPTTGETNFETRFIPEFRGKQVWTLNDVDADGQKGAQTRCAMLHRTVDWIGNVTLPLDVDKYPHGDVNDFVAQESGELLPLLEACPEWKPQVITNDLGYDEPEVVELQHAVAAKYTGKRVVVDAAVSMIDSQPFVIPSLVNVACDKSQQFCAICPVFASESSDFGIHPESSSVLDMVSSPRGAQREAMMSALGIPSECRVCKLQAKEFINVEDVRVSPRLEITSRSADRNMQPALCVGYGLELNESYDMVGRMYPHPKTQQAVLLISGSTPRQDALSSYVVQDPDRLAVFQPDSWTVAEVFRQLDRVYEDLEANVTRVFDRRDMHLLADLAYHSPLLIEVDGKPEKGWTEVLLIGDSANAKSQCVMRMRDHYGLGEKVEMKNATVAGLLGGCLQTGNRWMVSWGVVPTHDMRLVIFEEVKGASTDVLSKLTDMRSSGVAEIPKIEKRRTRARTRGIWLSNPRSDRQVQQYNFGVEIIKELIGNPEDIRRFDACMVISNADIEARRMNEIQSLRPVVEQRFTGELCRELILWCWTRLPHQVRFEREALDVVAEEHIRMCEKYSDAVPIVDRGSFRWKLVRLSAALAGRTFSCGDSHDEMLVRACHVRAVSLFLDRTYAAPAFGYEEYTEAVRLTQEMLDPDLIKKRFEEMPYARDVIRQLSRTPEIELTDLQDWCAYDRDMAKELLSFLVRKHALIRDGRSYRKTPPFIKFLKQVQENGVLNDRPAHIPVEEKF